MTYNSFHCRFRVQLNHHAFPLPLNRRSGIDEVKVDVTRAVARERKSHKGDKTHDHYGDTFQSNGKQFDASYDRGTLLSFVVGRGSVIKGFEIGLYKSTQSQTPLQTQENNSSIDFITTSQCSPLSTSLTALLPDIIRGKLARRTRTDKTILSENVKLVMASPFHRRVINQYLLSSRNGLYSCQSAS
jgi:hypothetical protein